MLACHQIEYALTNADKVDTQQTYRLTVRIFPTMIAQPLGARSLR